MGRMSWGPVALVGVFACVGALAGVALALWASTTTVYSGATIAAKSMRTDTVVVSDPARPMGAKPDQYVIGIAGTSQAASADSQYSAVVRAIRGGKLHQVGEDSLVLRPDPAIAGAQSGELRVLAWVADSLEIRTRNPRSTAVTGARLTVTAERLR